MKIVSMSGLQTTRITISSSKADQSKVNSHSTQFELDHLHRHSSGNILRGHVSIPGFMVRPGTESG